MNQRPFGEHTLYHTLFTQHARPDVLDPDRVTLSCGCWPQGTPQSSGHRERIFNWKGWATHIPLCFVVLRQSIPITGDGYTKQPTTYREFIDRKLVERASVFLIHIGSKYCVGSLPLGWPHMFHRRDRTGFVYRRISVKRCRNIFDFIADRPFGMTCWTLIDCLYIRADLCDNAKLWV